VEHHKELRTLAEESRTGDEESKRRARKAEDELAEVRKSRDRWKSKFLRQTTVLDALDYNNKKLGKELRRVKAELKRLQGAEARCGE